MEQENLITLKGSNEGLVVKYDKRSHVELSDGFYEKKDTNYVVRVNDKYYRKSSPLITLLDESCYGPNFYCLNEESVITAAGEVILASDSVKLTIDYIHLEVDETGVTNVCVNSKTQIVSRWSQGSISDNYRVQFPNKFNGYSELMYIISYANLLELESNGIIVERGIRIILSLPEDVLYINDPKLKSRPYINLRGSTPDALIKSGVLIFCDGIYYRSKQVEWSFDLNGQKYKPIRCIVTGRRIDNRENPYSQFYDSSAHNSIAKSILSKKIPINKGMKMFCEERMPDVLIDSDFETSGIPTKMGIMCSKQEHADNLDSLYEFLLENAKPAKISNWFAELSKEPKPILYGGFALEDTGGDYIFYKSRSKGVSISPTLSGSGGIGYTFGVELETSLGLLPRELCKSLDLNAVGDRSIGALEYVTEPLHGTYGMAKLMSQVEWISKYCAVDDSCGVHVHVGGADGAETPIFNRAFSVYSIMLGTQIEKELFSLMPDNRMDRRNSSGLPYCGSILEFSDTNMTNGRKMLSKFVFGHDEGFDGDDFKSTGVVPDNSSYELSRWASTRYKWLNLINCNTNNSNRRNGGGFVTIEFRAFNGTLNQDDIRAFVLISLSFVRFVENNRRMIERGGVKLKDILESSLNGNNISFMKSWIKDRKSLIKERRLQILNGKDNNVIGVTQSINVDIFTSDLMIEDPLPDEIERHLDF